MTAILTESSFLMTRKNESIIMICSLPLLLNHPPITVEIPAAESVVELETASSEKTFQLLSQRVNMNLPKNLLFKTSDCFHSFVSPAAFGRHAENASWLSGLRGVTRGGCLTGGVAVTSIHLWGSKNWPPPRGGWAPHLRSGAIR